MIRFPDFQPELKRNLSPDEMQGLANFLNKGKIKASGNLITDIERCDKTGTWDVPLKPGIELVDETDRALAESETPSVAITHMPDGAFELVLRHLGTDDEMRVARIHTSDAHFTPSETPNEK